LVLACSVTAIIASNHPPEFPLTPDPKLPLDPGPSTPQPAPSQASSAALLHPVQAPDSRPHSATQLWLHRSSVFLFVLISAVAGVLLVILPWTPEWTDNYLLLSFPWLRSFITTGFFRGLCSGLGLLDIWIGFWEALHYHEHN
jgi:hypothetical protein